VIRLDKSIEAGARQNSVVVEGVEYLIHTEFCWWVSFDRQIRKDCLYSDFDKYYIWEPPENKEAGYEELYKFYRNEQPLPHDVKSKKPLPENVIPFDYIIDSEYIRAAFKKEYDIDLMKEDLHWHDFLGFFNGLFNSIQSIAAARLDFDKNDIAKESRARWEIVNKKPKKTEENHGK
jgi:hypothetical protein